MAQVYKHGYWGPEVVSLDGSGELSSKVRGIFLHGQCHSLALAIRQLTKWPLYGFVDWEDGDTKTSPGHIVSWCPELEDYIDIGGRKALDRWRDVFPDCEVHPIYPSTIKRGMSMYLPISVEAAMPYAKTVLRKYCGRSV